MSAIELDDARAAAGGAAGKDAYVREMFSAIAPRYDLLNHWLSLNLDRRWRRRAIAALQIGRRPDGRYLDLCAGTLDVGAAIASATGFTGSVIGADFAEPMLRAGAGKAPAGRLAPVTADALALPIAPGTCSGAIVAFGIRNVADIDLALREVSRVLEPGGRFVILEFTTPSNPVFRAGFNAYFHHVLPRIGRVVSGHRSAYSYLPISVAQFPLPPELGARMTAAGFGDVRWETMMFGVVAIHVGVKVALKP
jgi:demethylmenaquinone methyltransferase/2-methoxy-6-polyprenyl-1,4-benzoquinol methylase